MYPVFLHKYDIFLCSILTESYKLSAFREHKDCLADIEMDRQFHSIIKTGMLSKYITAHHHSVDGCLGSQYTVRACIGTTKQILT